MILFILAVSAFGLALLPAVLFVWNLFLVIPPHRVRPVAADAEAPLVSVLIPARNEAQRIGAALDSVLASREVNLEVIVLDDQSTDGTGELVSQYVARDARVHLHTAPNLPRGWCGKQYACHTLARHARGEWFVFVDADVRLSPTALGRMVAFMRRSGAALGSGVPRQVTDSWMERLLVPLVHIVLLGFLPVWRMRRCTKPAYAAGCGQLFIVQAEAYRKVGGHARIPETLHDGIKLPRLFRQNGFRTDLFDATDLASCRMYVGAREVVEGSMKNAHEALASPAMIVPMTMMLLGGQIMPWLLLGFWPDLSGAARGFACAGVALSMLPRALAAWRFRQSVLGVILHPVAIALFLCLQWWAFARVQSGRPAQWRGRAYSVYPRAGTSVPGETIGVAHRRVES